MTTFIGALTTVEKAAGVTSVNLPLPGGAAAGDMAVAGFGCNSNTIPSASTGWTLILAKSSTADTLAPNSILERRTISAGDITNGFVTLDTVTSAVGNCGGLVLRDVTTTQDFAAQYLDKTSTANGNFAFTAVTASETDVTLVYLVSQATVATATMTPPTAPATFTEDSERTTGRNFTMGHLIWSGSGSTGTMTVVSGAVTRGVGLLAGFQSAAVTAFTGTATLDGAGTLATTQAPGPAQTAALSGSGTLTTTQVPRPAVVAALSGSGTLSTTQVPRPVVTAALSGSGTLSTSAVVASTAIAALSGTGTLSTTQVVAAVGTAVLSGTGSLVALQLYNATSIEWADTIVTSVGWVNPSNAIGPDDSTYATWTSSTANAVSAPLEVGFGDFADVPGDATNISVRVRVKGYWS